MGPERWGLSPGRAGLGWAGMMLGSEGSTLGYTLTLAVASPHVWSDWMCPIPVHSHCDVLAPAASQFSSTWTQPRSIFTAPGVGAKVE